MAIKKYFKFDSELGYLEDKDDINYFSTIQMRKVAFGKMLGDFDENGLYVINQKIVDELIKMPKVIVEIIEGSDLIRSKVKADTFFHFILTIEDNKAVFKLLEKIPHQSNKDFNSGSYSDINEYILDEVIIPDKDFNRNALYEKYNIATENDGDVLSIFDMDELSIALYYNLIEKIKVDYLVENALILKEKELEAIEADYFEQILTVLEEFKEFGGKVIDGVKKDLAEKHTFVIISKPFFQQTVNEIVDSYIDLYLQDLSPEQKDQVLNRIREIKAKYYQKFKTLLPIEVVNKAGVRFSPSQLVQEGIIGGLAQEIVTKGFTSSDVRKILINEDELQLSIAKIRAMVRENEEICKRDNAKAVDITRGRKATTEFYNKLEKENKVDILKPDTTLIKSAIGEKVDVKAKDADKKAEVGKSIGSSAKVQGGKVQGGKTAGKAVGGKTAGKANGKAGGKAVGGKTAGGKSAGKTAPPQAKNDKAPKSNNDFILITGTGTNNDKGKQQVPGVLFDELMGDDNRTVKTSNSARKQETFVHADSHDLIK